jgi:hypothetical protein
VITFGSLEKEPEREPDGSVLNGTFAFYARAFFFSLFPFCFVFVLILPLMILLLSVAAVVAVVVRLRMLVSFS